MSKKAKKKVLREHERRSRSKVWGYDLLERAIHSSGTSMFVVGTALAAACAALPWVGGSLYWVEAIAGTLPMIGAAKLAKDMISPVVSKAKEDAQDEALSAKILLITDGKGLDPEPRREETGDEDGNTLDP